MSSRYTFLWLIAVFTSGNSLANSIIAVWKFGDFNIAAQSLVCSGLLLWIAMSIRKGKLQ